MRRELDLDRSHALDVPLRFFFNIPLFGLLAAGVVVAFGADAFASRWSPVALALTHLFTLGMLTSAMAGALIQILAVAMGLYVAGPRLSATVVHAGLTAGTVALVMGFLLSASGLFVVAAVLLAGALLWLIVACAIGFWRYRANALSDSADVLGAVRLALIALLVTASVGVALATARMWPLPVSPIALTDLHAMWGLAGWIGLLTIGMAFQLIPMFQVTELYPRVLTRWLALVVFLSLALISAASVFFPRARFALAILLLIGYAVFAAATFYLLWTRKRPKADTTTLFWRTAMVGLACCVPLWVAQVRSDDPRWTVALGVVALFGVAWSLVNGMMHKIVPFLLWYHAQRSLTGAAMQLAPKVRDMISERAATGQFCAHVVAFALLLSAVAWPAFARIAGLAMGVSMLWLGVNIAGALRLCLRVKRKAAAMASS